MSKPFNTGLNAAVLSVANNLMPRGWEGVIVDSEEVADTIPFNYEEQKLYALQHGRYRFPTAEHDNETGIFEDVEVWSAYTALMTWSRQQDTEHGETNSGNFAELREFIERVGRQFVMLYGYERGGQYERWFNIASAVHFGTLMLGRDMPHHWETKLRQFQEDGFEVADRLGENTHDTLIAMFNGLQRLLAKQSIPVVEMDMSKSDGLQAAIDSLVSQGVDRERATKVLTKVHEGLMEAERESATIN